MNLPLALALAAALLLVPAGGLRAEEPPLPPSPEAESTQEEPALPPVEGEPALPPMPSEEAAAAAPAEAPPGWSDWLDERLGRLPVPLHGFWEARAGLRYVEDNDISRDATLGETRLQLESDPFWRSVQFGFKADLLYDAVLRDAPVQWREANVAFSPLSFMDVKLGRQILTWGTGDLVFLNDLFPKDYESFFIGRDVEYLKAPSDAVKVSLFGEAANLDVVYTPHFDPDVFVSGERLSYFNPLLGARAGEDMRLRAEEPGEWFEDDEVALRIYRSVGSYELAGYAYRGFWKSPVGINPATNRFTFPRLQAFGASVRGPVAAGIGNVEVAYYDSRDDGGGDDPFVPNSQLRLLAGYSQDLPRVAHDLTVGVQYYLERMMDYGAYERNLPASSPEADRTRHLLTLRLTKLLLQQDLELSLFTFWSPSDHDAYLRPYVSYDLTDRWRVNAGANVFLGDDGHTQFGQFDRNNNVYLGVRYSF